MALGRRNKHPGGGGVFRNDQGMWLWGFSVKLKTRSAAKTELMTVREGLVLAETQNYPKLHIELDAKAIKMMLEGAELNLKHEFDVVLADIKKLLEGSCEITFIYTRRHGNRVAHDLAQFASTMEENVKIHNTILQCAIVDYAKDMRNKPVRS